MQLWLLLVLVFIIQEPVTASGVLLEAYQNHYNIWGIHLLFIVATLFDIAVGYYIGTILHKKSDQIRLIKYLKKKFDALTDFMGKKGKVLTLLLFVPILFPISAIFLPWFEMPFIEVAAYTFLGELVFWYGYEWLLVLGVKSFANDSHFALYAVLCISLALSIVLKIIWKKVEKGKKKSFLTKE